MNDLDIFQQFAKKDATKKVMGNNAVIYTRVSHSSQEDNNSLEAQLKYCTAFAQKRNLNIVQSFGGTYESAKTDDRKEFNKMLKFIKQSGQISYIVVYSYERFSRTGAGGAKIAQDLQKKYGIVTLSCEQQLDPTTISGAFQQNMWFLFGQMNNEERKQKTVMGMREVYRKGYTPRQCPKGYVNLNKGSKAVDQKIVLTAEGKLLQKAFHWKANEGMSNVDIVKRLAEHGLKLNLKRINEIFKNPYYCGLLVSKMIPNEVIEGKHEKMVSREIFLKVNNISSANNTHPTRHRQSNENLPLKRFALCGTCEKPLTGFLVKAKGLYYYKCRTNGCGNVNSAKKAHEHFKNMLSLFCIDSVDLELVTEALSIFYTPYFQKEQKDGELATKQINLVEKKIKKIKERHALGEINQEIFNEFFSDYSKELSNFKKNSGNSLGKSSNLKNCIKKVIGFCKNPSAYWSQADFNQRLRFQKILFPEGISIDKQNGIVQTTRINSFFAPIPIIIEALRKLKSGQSIKIDQLSALVTSPGFKPGTS
jgi:site-specific DNA recombinase